MQPKRTCSIPGCERPHEARGWCSKHYFRWWYSGDPSDRPTPEQAFWQRVKIDANGCWIWTGAVRRGYGFHSLGRRGSARPAHRYSYELHVEPIPVGKVLHHRCEVKLCVNPDHLEPVTRGEHPGLHGPTWLASQNAAKTHCKRGHEFTPENTRIVNGTRICVTCRRQTALAHKRRQEAKQRVQAGERP